MAAESPRDRLADMLVGLRGTQVQLDAAPSFEELAEQVRVLRREHLHIRLECQRLATLMEGMQARLDRHCSRGHSG